MFDKFASPSVKLFVPLDNNYLAPLATMFSASVIDGVIRIIKSLENSGVSIDGVSETVKQELKNKRMISW